MRNYYPYIIIGGEEWTSQEAMDINAAYDEAARMKAERSAEEAGVKVFTQECVKIISWTDGKYWHGHPSYLYKFVI